MKTLPVLRIFTLIIVCGIGLGAVFILLNYELSIPTNITSAALELLIGLIIIYFIFRLLSTSQSILDKQPKLFIIVGLLLLLAYIAEQFVLEFTVMRPSWLPLWIEEVFKLSGILFLIISGNWVLTKIKNDFSQLQEKHKEASKVADFLTLINDSANKLAIITTDNNGIITRYNQGAELLFETVADKAVGSSIFQYFSTIRCFTSCTPVVLAFSSLARTRGSSSG